jgi:hypothetical protein
VEVVALGLKFGRLREASAASASGTLERGTKECPTCDGSGKIMDGNRDCPDCNGSGHVREASMAADTDRAEVEGAEGLDDSNSVEVDDCPDCDNGLNADGTPCSTCDGAGWTAVREAVLSTAARKRIPKSNFAIPSKAPDSGSYPIPDIAHARNALARSSGKPEEATVKAAVYAKYPQLKESAGDASLRLQIDALGSQLDRLREGTSVALDRQDTPLSVVKTTDGREGYAVVLIREGRGNTEDNNWYTRESVKDLVDSKRADGMQAYANHPPLDEEDTLPERNVKEIVGTYADVKFAESDGKATATAILVPIKGAGYDWVQTLAEAAASHRGPKPLCGISLYGASAGSFGDRPDGSYGRMVSEIHPTSGDIVTNAGAGGEFVRRLMESARTRRALRETSDRKRDRMKLSELQPKLREAAERVREADTDEKKTAALTELDELAAAEIESEPLTVDGLAEAQPALIAQLRESAKVEAAKDNEQLREQLRESQRLNQETAATWDTLRVLKENEVGEEDAPWFLDEVKVRGLRESDAIEQFVKQTIDREKRVRERAVAAYEGVEGVPGRRPSDDGERGLSVLREAGVPTKELAAA